MEQGNFNAVLKDLESPMEMQRITKGYKDAGGNKTQDRDIWARH